MSKPKNKVTHLTEEDYKNYISQLKDERPTKAIVGNREVELFED
jgi:hypothetical protein